eukprot:jgi/Chrpa1/25809/Chrysochromulina_OHIO_Genome00001623-RA
MRAPRHLCKVVERRPPMTTLRLPVERLQQDFARAHAANPSALLTGDGISLSAWLQELLATPGALEAVPSLNSTTADALPDGAIVRFIGMVQDVHDPEYYDGVYEEVHHDGSVHLRTSMYQGCLDDVGMGAHVASVRARQDIVWQRAPVVCVPIPSRSPWVDSALAGPAQPKAAAPSSGSAATRSGARGKRSAAEEAGGPGLGAEPMEEEAALVAEGEDAHSKRTRALASGQPTGGESCESCEHGDTDGDNPGSDEKAWARASARGVLLKVYGGVEEGEGAFKVHELIEVIGVLERAPEGGYDVGAGGSYDVDDEVCMSVHPLAREVAAERQQRPPPSAQPRVHTIATRRFDDVHAAWLPPATSAAEAEAIATAREQLPSLRQAVLDALGACLGGDALAAEYVLLASLSRIMQRHGEAPIGKLHLNITGCPSAAPAAPRAEARSAVAASLLSGLTELLPVCASTSLSVSALNARALAPSKDHEANCIWPAPLQLPAGALLLLDEASLGPGALSERGVANVRALTLLLDAQKVPYDFTFFAVDFGVDVSIISLSTSKSMLAIGCQLPLRVAPVTPSAAALAPAEARTAARRYLGLASRLQHRLSAIGPELSQLAQDEFVTARQADPSVNADDFARLLTLTRLVAASALAPAVTMEHYAHAKALEMARCARVRTREVAV